MNNRDGVIKGLEYCTQYGSMCGCDCNGHWGWTDDSHTGMELLDEYRTKCPYGNCKTGCVKTLAKDALALLKVAEPCMDAVSRQDVLDLAQTYGPATYDMPYGSGDMIIRPEDVKALPSVQPIPLARVMALEEIKEGESYWFTAGEDFIPRPVICVHREDDAQKPYIVFTWQYGTFSWESEDYGKAWWCWTSRPTDEQRKETKWND